MTPGGRDLERPPTDRLAAHLGQVGGAVCPVVSRGGRGRRVGPVPLAAQHTGQLAQRRRTVHVAAANERRLPHVAQRDHQPERRHGVGQGDHAGNVPQ